MSHYDSQKDRIPLGHIGRIEISATTIIVAILVASMVACAMLMGLRAVPSALMFDRDAFLDGQVWRLATYPLLNIPSFFVAFDMFLLYWFGREVEYFLGRRTFLRLYGLNILAPAAVLLLIPHSFLAGSRCANFAVFIAFAAIYPRAQIFFGIEARWLAGIYLAISVLQALAYHDWSWIIPLLVSAGASFLFVRYEQGLLSFALPRRQTHLRVIEGGLPRAPQPVNVDAILDKINKSGLQSLTAKEREQLDKAREEIIRK